MAISVLLVCTGNTCRSAMAEGILRSLIPEGRRVEIAVSSAGTADLRGAHATEHAQTVCLEHGVDIGGHRSRGLTGEMLSGSDLILGMTHAHVNFVGSLDPDASGRTFLLSEFADGSDHDVPDPIGGSMEEYRAAYDMIEGHLAKALPAIIELAGGGER
jgi:protein-tyrosine-phosphatase